MREIELKAVVDNWEERRLRLERAGAVTMFIGRLQDRRYDTATGALVRRDEVLRLRVYRGEGRPRAELGWKGATGYEGGYKLREELAASTDNPEALMEILRRLGFIMIRAIDREIVQYELCGAVVRLERYPQMDDLVEVEGSPDAIERAIQVLGMARSSFTADRLPQFAVRFQERTGARAVLSEDELEGTASYRLEDA